MANSAQQIAVGESDMALALNSKGMQVICTLYESMPEMAILGLHMHKKPEAVFGIGDPDPNAFSKGAAFGGANIDPIKIREAERVGTFSPLVRTIRQNDGKRKSQRDTGAVSSAHSGTDAVITVTTTNGVITGTTISNAGTGYSGAVPFLDIVDATGSCGFGARLVATVSGGVISAVTILSGGRGYASSGITIIPQAGKSAGEKFDRFLFKWSGYENIGTLYDNDVADARATLQAAPGYEEGDAELSLATTEMTTQVTEQAAQLADDLWYGMPTVGNTDTARMYDQPFGFLNAIDDSNVYGGVDRSQAANHWARAKVDANPHSGWKFGDMVEDAHQTKGLAYKNGGLDVFFLPPGLISRFKDQANNQLQRVTIEDELRELAKYGFKSDVIQYGNTIGVGCSRCPEGTAIGLNMKAILILFRSGKKFTPSALVKQNGVRVGGLAGIDGSTFTINTEWMPMIVAPELCVKYTGL